jgi:hypothetical protein
MTVRRCSPRRWKARLVANGRSAEAQVLGFRGLLDSTCVQLNVFQDASLFLAAFPGAFPRSAHGCPSTRLQRESHLKNLLAVALVTIKDFLTSSGGIIGWHRWHQLFHSLLPFVQFRDEQHVVERIPPPSHRLRGKDGLVQRDEELRVVIFHARAAYSILTRMPGALGSREEFRNQGISILGISAPEKLVPRAHLSGITGRDEKMVHHLDVAVLRGRGVRKRARMKSICREGDKGVRLETKTVEIILLGSFQ